MRNNGPTTGHNVPVQAGEELVSSTDTHGTIRFCNDTFERISGFPRDELIGQPHNIIRHPEMPEAVFALMWQALKRGAPWMGIVKNRCKNGDHYWVDAYVTPLKENGQIQGYESVRAQASPERIERAERAYARLRAGRPACPRWRTGWQRGRTGLLMALASLPIAGIGLWLSGVSGTTAAAVIPAASVVLGLLAQALEKQRLGPALNRARARHHDPVAAYVYTGRSDALGEIEFAQLALEARLRTALGRFGESARELNAQSLEAGQQVAQSHRGMDEQQRETEQVVEAMSQMAQAVQEVAGGAADTSSATRDATGEVDKGQGVIRNADRAIGELSEQVSSLGQVLERLTSDSGEIGKVVDVIGEVADQTNLLALNAAIEAARAGEQGRGFAVVADEVRTLAQRTQDSTGHIQSIIGKLGRATNEASESMAQCLSLVERSVGEMENVRTALAGIAESVQNIDQRAHQIAAAAEEQSATAGEVERNTRQIHDIAQRTQEEVARAEALNREMEALAHRQRDLITRFESAREA